MGRVEADMQPFAGLDPSADPGNDFEWRVGGCS